MTSSLNIFLRCEEKFILRFLFTGIKGMSVSNNTINKRKRSGGVPSLLPEGIVSPPPPPLQHVPSRKSSVADEEIYCLCRQPYVEGSFMLACDICDDWYHGPCVGVSEVR